MLEHSPRASAPAPAALIVALAMALVLLGAAPAALADPSDEPTPPEHAYSADGQDVQGGASLAQATTVSPGIHRDSFERGAESTSEDGTVKYYRVAVEDGERVHAAATIAAPPYPDGRPEDDEGLGLAIGFRTAGGDTCTSDDDFAGEDMTGDGPVTAWAVSEAVGPDGCSGEELFLRVARQGSRAADEPLPVEIQVAIQPPGIGGGAPAVDEEVEDDGASPVSPVDDQPIELGRSFAAATPLEPGSHVVELVPGETGMVSTQVREGQRLRWRTEVTAQPDGGKDVLALRTFNAAREQVTVGGGSWTAYDGDPIAGGGMAAPVDLGNRSSELRAVQSAWLPGTHTIQLQRLQLPADAEPGAEEPLRLILTLEVEGEVAPDAVEGTVLELGETTSQRDGLFGSAGGLGRVAMFVGAGLLTVTALVTGVAGILVLRLRSR
ncbi:hypothetical protein ACFQS2_15465 [Brachybacterium sp. GCM10030267]|uniref:hypothetical protein n=1 Tax=Brachybacterium sp. GCM10030267 TaxID=3273381 RepID=UPI00360B3F16